ncbi:MAG: hypothetical protein ACKVOH_03980 [Chlamydiales bacterium]
MATPVCFCDRPCVTLFFGTMAAIGIALLIIGMVGRYHNPNHIMRGLDASHRYTVYVRVGSALTTVGLFFTCCQSYRSRFLTNSSGNGSGSASASTWGSHVPPPAGPRRRADTGHLHQPHGRAAYPYTPPGSVSAAPPPPYTPTAAAPPYTPTAAAPRGSGGTSSTRLYEYREGLARALQGYTAPWTEDFRGKLQPGECVGYIVSAGSGLAAERSSGTLYVHYINDQGRQETHHCHCGGSVSVPLESSAFLDPQVVHERL